MIKEIVHLGNFGLDCRFGSHFNISLFASGNRRALNDRLHRCLMWGKSLFQGVRHFVALSDFCCCPSILSRVICGPSLSLIAFFDRPLVTLTFFDSLFHLVLFLLFTLIIGAILGRLQINCDRLMGGIVGCVTRVG